MENKIKKMVEDGHSIRAISRALDLLENNIREIIKKNNFTLEKEIFDPSNLKRIFELYNQNIPIKTLGRKFQVNKKRIYDLLDKENILRDRSLSKRMKKVNEKIFDIFDSKEKIYWLGFLYKCCHNYIDQGFIDISISKNEIDNLKKFVIFMGGHSLKDIKYKKRNVSYRINSKRLCQILKDLPFFEERKFPEWLGKEYYLFFVRGLFDGGGNLKFLANKNEWKWSFKGSEDLCKIIKDFFKNKDLIIPLYFSKRYGNILECSGNLKIQKICDILYETTLCSNYKFNKYKELIELNNKNHPFSKDKKYGKHQILTINGFFLDKQTIENLPLEIRQSLLKPAVELLLRNGYAFSDDLKTVLSHYKSLVEHKTDLSIKEHNNNDPLGGLICKYFCRSFYSSTTPGEDDPITAFGRSEKLEKAIIQILNLDGGNDNKNLSIVNISDRMRRQHECASVSIFKPRIAKFICEKYSDPGDLVGDYSCGFGGRMLGAVTSGRRYIGTDPLTVPELKEMIKVLDLKNCELIHSGSEDYRGKENSVDLYWSSPPYFDLEIYSNHESQAYNRGEDYFYNIYWRKTLENVKYMLKPNKWFGLNILKNYEKMINIAKEYFGDILCEEILTSKRDHMEGDAIKHDFIFMFKNKK